MYYRRPIIGWKHGNIDGLSWVGNVAMAGNVAILMPYHGLETWQ